MRLAWKSVLAAVAVAYLMMPAQAHEGHDHGTEAPPAPANSIPRGEARSEFFEAVATVRNGQVTVYLDRAGTNEPVTDALVEVETPEGPKNLEPRPDGTYTLAAPWTQNGGHFDFILTVAADGDIDVLTISVDTPGKEAAGPVAEKRAGLQAMLTPAFLIPASLGFVIGIFVMALGRRRSAAASVAVIFLVASAAVTFAHEGHDDAPPASTAGGDRAFRQPDGVIFVPKPVQRIFGVRTMMTTKDRLQLAIELPGRIIADPSSSGYVQTAVGGRLSPPPGGFPRLGSKVNAGDVLAYVTPPIQAIDVSDMRQRQGELEQQISIVERRVARFETLAPSGAVPRFQLEEARLELEGLKQRRASLDNVRREPESLIAPVSGVVAEGTPIAGQIAQSNSIVFQIVDPSRLWVEALSFSALADTRAASGIGVDGRKLALKYLGSGFTERSQTIPVQFAIEGDTAGLRVGQFVNVLAEAGEAREGIAVPRSAVVRTANGQDFVFEHVSAERFEPRQVRTAPLDGDRVLIAAGIDPGKRVVVQGAELLDHVR